MNTIPNPETLRPLLEAALAIMEPNDPAKSELVVGIALNSSLNITYRISFYLYHKEISRKCFIGEISPEKALECFKNEYEAPLTKERVIAELEARLAALKGGKS